MVLFGSEINKNRACVERVSMWRVSNTCAPGGGEFLLIIRRPVWQGLPQIQQPVVASGEPPALQCRTPSRHHLELQNRRDYTPADRAARTCWLGCPGLLYYLAA
ncbi:hypothetical protein TNCV_701771 [Trichonephila clavipes]|nr:hypothetical protein TNCV_701771 [Trichonephila clavipes]